MALLSGAGPGEGGVNPMSGCTITAVPVESFPPTGFPPGAGLKNPAKICAVTGLEDSSDEGQIADPGDVSKFVFAPGLADSVEAATMVSLVEGNEPAAPITALVALVTIPVSGTDAEEFFAVGVNGFNDFQANIVSGSSAGSNRMGAGPMLGR